MKYPSREEIFKHFQLLKTGEFDKFFDIVSDNVDWTIMGTSPMSEQFSDLKTFREKTISRLATIFHKPGLLIEVQNVIGGGDQEWASVELKGSAECLDGQPYRMTYNWVCRFDEAGKIVQVRAYLDTEQLTRVLRDNQVPNYFTPLKQYT